MHRQTRDGFALVDDVALLGFDQADHNIKRRRLARAVRSQQPDNFGRIDKNGNAVHDAPLAVLLDKFVGRKQRGADGASICGGRSLLRQLRAWLWLRLTHGFRSDLAGIALASGLAGIAFGGALVGFGFDEYT